MRPPRKSWALAARAAREIVRALDSIMSTAFCPTDEHEVALAWKRLRRAKAAARRLSAFVRDSEECEMP